MELIKFFTAVWSLLLTTYKHLISSNNRFQFPFRIEFIWFGFEFLKMPLNITASQKLPINVLVVQRCAEINVDHFYVFAASRDSTAPLRGYDIHRTHSVKCGAQKPNLLRLKFLLKHVATFTNSEPQGSLFHKF